MAGRYELIFFVVCVFLISQYTADLPPPPSPPTKKPKIISEFETIIESNDNHTVFCEGDRPLKWTIPYVEDTKSWTTFVQKDEQPINPDYKYGSRLYIANMTYPFVGFYYCHHEDVDINDEDWSANIYLYVNDNEHLTTLEVGPNIETITVPLYREAIIPCRPTSPDVKVALSKFSDEEVPLDTINDKETLYHYEPMYGFFTNDTKEKHKDIIFKCTFAKNGLLQTAHLDMVVEIPVSHLAKPDLRDLSEGHTVVGSELKLNCSIRTTNGIRFQWSTPKAIDPWRIHIYNQTQVRFDKISQNLTVYNVTLEDEGMYFCMGIDNQGHNSSAGLYVKIFNVGEHFLNMSEPNGLYSIIVPAGEPFVQWSIDVQGHPIPTLKWFDNENVSIPMGDGTKYEAYYNARSNQAFLRIKNISIINMGYYRLEANNTKTLEKLYVFLNVTDAPTALRIETDLLHDINTPSTVKCLVHANPEPKFDWEFKNCENDDCSFLPINSTVTKTDMFKYTSEVTINASRSGIVKCSASNDKDHKEIITTTKQFYVSDVKDGFDIFGLDSTVNLDEENMAATVALGDPIRVTCGASIYSYSNISWIYNGQVLTGEGKYKITKSYTEYSNKIQLEIAEASLSDSGLYICQVVGDNEEFLHKTISFRVVYPQYPLINSTNMGDQMNLNIPEELTMFCKVFGIPKPTITWFKNDLEFNPSSEPNRILIEENNEKITFKRTEEKDEGTYKCEARNRIGVASKQRFIKFKNLLKHQTWLICVIAFLTLVSITAIVFIVIRLRKEKKLQRELKKLGLANFEKGAVENINPELGIDDQAELLPYDRKWEFPIESLKLGKQLGSGAFGVVMKGEAKNIIDGEPVTTVAVKKVKKNADNTHIRALASELKVMVHLGKHLNVVNLLGACTKNVAKRELLVIVEYCRFGNLQNYLIRHRDIYINQIDPKTGKIDYNIGQEYFDRSYSVSSNRSNTQSPSLKYAALTFSNSSNYPILPPANSMGDYRENAQTVASGATEMTTIPQDDGVITSNSSVQPEWRSNYKGDYKGNVKPICTKDLLAWAFQVARGMEYLASRKVLHGDLAARNILLADNNVVKICDFGLAKSMYKNDNYKKRGDGPLPVKWMAIESIRDRVFSTQSDVWSFGIVLWEFFSLARTPYPGMEANERLYEKLVDGYRMESPEYAPKEIYNMMTNCWAPKPLARPSFSKLSEEIGVLLEDTLRKHYIDLNDPYLVMNTHRIESGESDYLAMLSPPTFEALSSPHYVNEKTEQESLEDSGYLSMKPNMIFSPGLEGQAFDFNVTNRKHLDPEGGNRSELLPMLRRPSESDCETPIPTTPNSFSNPSYLLPPKIQEETTDTDNSGIVKSCDNYVNMPQNKSFIKEKNLNNPFVDVNSENKSDVHYVNGNSRDWESVQV